MAEAPRRRVFVDTNILIYSVLNDGSVKGARADAIVGAGPVVSVQNLNEFANVALRKLHMPSDAVRDALDRIRALCPGPLSITLATHESALALVRRHGFSFYDALLVASALDAGCNVLLSEDMHDGLVVAGALTIRNPFRADA